MSFYVSLFIDRPKEGVCPVPVTGNTTNRPITKVLVANRGEIAVRIIRAAADAGISSVAVYADSDVDAPFVRLADEAFALGGDTAAQTYLNGAAIIAVAERAGADAVHPGYGFLAENADFARDVQAAGLTWIGPSPEAIAALGDKVTARAIAERVGAPMAPGTHHPVDSAAEVVDFARTHGLPIAIKAAFGGGGRGMKVAHTIEEVPELFESATREATAAFGRGECFVERYLDRARHVECQVLADTHGTVVVVGDRDCSLQRRFQKLVEESPAPFLTAEQRSRLHESAIAICREAGYVGAGTVEYLVGADGLISFLEVNTRLQVEHPVTEATSGIDLVRAQFRIAEGHRLDLPEEITPRGHAIEFRINGEDPGAHFMPAPGTITAYHEPTGPGVRVDSGVRGGSVVGGQFDSMLAKLIVWGATRTEALQRARRALAEFQVEGLPTVLDFHRRVVTEPAFTGDEDHFDVYTRWIEEEWDNPLTPYVEEDPLADASSPTERNRITVEVDGRRIEVALPATFGVGGAAPRKRKRARTAGAGPAASSDAVVAPMQGTVIKVNAEEGQSVAEGDVIVVLEAMKMENPVKAHKAGTVTGLAVAAGDGVAKGDTMLEITD